MTNTEPRQEQRGEVLLCLSRTDGDRTLVVGRREGGRVASPSGLMTTAAFGVVQPNAFVLRALQGLMTTMTAMQESTLQNLLRALQG
ncbi:hypothetical protein [Streptomyces kronopolitis]|uniref:hypothetical protein n=1 Tax=Streptomyces kronopolitis TaxID=1612435 RepID=UPI003D95D9FB